MERPRLLWIIVCCGILLVLNADDTGAKRIPINEEVERRIRSKRDDEAKENTVKTSVDNPDTNNEQDERPCSDEENKKCVTKEEKNKCTFSGGELKCECGADHFQASGDKSECVRPCSDEEMKKCVTTEAKNKCNFKGGKVQCACRADNYEESADNSECVRTCTDEEEKQCATDQAKNKCTLVKDKLQCECEAENYEPSADKSECTRPCSDEEMKKCVTTKAKNKCNFKGGKVQCACGADHFEESADNSECVRTCTDEEAKQCAADQAKNKCTFVKDKLQCECKAENYEPSADKSECIRPCSDEEMKKCVTTEAENKCNFKGGKVQCACGADNFEESADNSECVRTCSDKEKKKCVITEAKNNCTLNGGKVQCECGADNFEESADNSECVLICDDNTCVQGNCTVVDRKASCKCHEGYVGPKCDCPDPCKSSKCVGNNVKCERDPRFCKVFKCICDDAKHFYNDKTNTCEDVDTCIYGIPICSDNQICQSPGICVCKPEYKEADGKCSDKPNYCREGVTPRCNETKNENCDVKPGDEGCYCKANYYPKDGGCTEGATSCTGCIGDDRDCTATAGVTTCKCKDNGCRALKCSDLSSFCKQPFQVCEEENGVLTCKCKKGYKQDDATKQCVFHDKCKDGTLNCTENEVCSNEEEKCNCKPGYVQIKDTCTDWCTGEGLRACRKINAACINSQCICWSGFELSTEFKPSPGVTPKGVCKQATKNSYPGVVKVEKVFLDKYKDPSSKEYTTFVDDFQSSMASVLQLKPEAHIKVRQLRNGSVDTDFEIVNAAESLAEIAAKYKFGVQNVGNFCIAGPMSLAVKCPDDKDPTFKDACSGPDIPTYCPSDTYECKDGTPFKCTCKSGFVAVDVANSNKQECSDINECVSNIHNCSAETEICWNTRGSFECGCKDNYLRDSDGVCKEICNDKNFPCENEGTCSKDGNSYKCTCPDGFGGLKCDLKFDIKLIEEQVQTSNIGLTVGVGVLAGVLVLTLIIGGIIIYRLKKRAKKGSPPEDDYNDDHGLHDLGRSKDKFAR